MEECINVSFVSAPESSFKTFFRMFCLVVGIFICLVWFWHNISPCRPPLGVCGQATKNGIRTLDLLDEAQILTEISFVTILCGIIQSELNCLDQFFQRCLSSTDKDNKFYSSLHLEGISAKQQFCGIGNGFESEGSSVPSCWSSLRRRRDECVRGFSLSPGGRVQVIMDSLFDDLDTGVYRKEFCWAIREAAICGLGIFRQECGEEAAKSLYHLTRNITNMIFTDKCDQTLRPDWEESTLRLMRQSLRPVALHFLKFSCFCLVVFVVYIACKCCAGSRRRMK